VNVGSGADVEIIELARLIAKEVGYQGEILTDLSKPDGTPRKLTDSSLLASLGWEATTTLEDGISKTYGAFLSSVAGETEARL
jgi:GDP-L-fucose synthase